LAPEDAVAARRGASNSRGFLGLRHRFPLALVEVDNSPTLDIRRSLGVGPPIGGAGGDGV
jgi:hypothetical protein